jgi:drug/metabolite transporter (DMT)-like permease
MATAHTKAAHAHAAHPARGYMLAAIAAVGWAAGGLTSSWLFKATGTEVDPATLSGARSVLAALMLFGYLAAFRRRDLKISVSQVPFLAVFGVLGLAAVHFTYVMTIKLTNAPTAILLEYLAPILVLGVSVAFLGERLTWALPAGVVLSILGCALMVGVVGGDTLNISVEGLAWGLASAVVFALYTLLGKYAAPRFSPWTLLAYGLAFASLFWLVWLGGPARIVELLSDPVRAGAVVFIALVSTVVPFGAFLTALHHIDATKATITATLEPVLAGIGTYLIPALYKPLTPWQFLGGACVLAAVVVAQAPQMIERRRLMREDAPVLPPPA